MENLDQNDELEKAFRDNIEGKHIMPPNSVWANVKIATLETQMLRFQQMMVIFKGLSVMLGIGLLTTTILLVKRPSQIIVAQKPVVITKIDTVFITSIKPIYLKSSNETIIQKDDLVVDDKENSYENETNFKDESQANALIENTKTPAIETEASTAMNQNSSILEHQNSQIKAKNNTDILNKTQTTTIETNIENKEKSAFNNWKNIEANYLKSIDYKKSEIIVLPKIRKPFVENIAKNDDKILKEPFIKRLSLSGYFLPEVNKLDVRRKDRKAFDYANQEIRGSLNVGLRGSLKVTNRWSFVAGIEYGRLAFDEYDKKQNFTAENFNGVPTFLYRNALGTAIIPNQSLATSPQLGSVLQIETNEPISSAFLRANLGIKYDIANKNLRIGSINPLKMTFYGLYCANISLPFNQETHLDVFQQNQTGKRFSLTEVKNQQPYLRLDLGFGLGFDSYKNIGFFIEPSYSQSLTSLVRNMPIDTFMKSLGLKIGLNWKIKDL